MQQFNELNELQTTLTTTCVYDLNGYLIQKITPVATFNYTYDPLNQLIEASSETIRICFAYDPLGRRISKTSYTQDGQMWTETYLYQDENEIGIISKDGKLLNLRVLGIQKDHQVPTTVAIEAEGNVYAALSDIHGNIRRLVHHDTREVAEKYDFTAFGEGLNKEYLSTFSNPWRYASQHYEPELG